MQAQEQPVGADAGLPKVWAALSVAAALLSVIGSIVGLLAPKSIYGKETYTLAAPVRLPHSFLIGITTLFAMLWLSEIVPDLLAGRTSSPPVPPTGRCRPTRYTSWTWPSFFRAVLPGGVLLSRRHRFGYATAPAQLIFLELTCLPILLTPAIANTRGHDARMVGPGPDQRHRGCDLGSARAFFALQAGARVTASLKPSSPKSSKLVIITA